MEEDDEVDVDGNKQHNPVNKCMRLRQDYFPKG